MMLMMQAHIDSMAKLSPEQMTRTMARHERMMSQTMDQMGGEMRQMGMAETPGWSALADSVRQDLAELPSLSGKALSSRTQARAEQVRRLMGMHKRMMGAMQVVRAAPEEYFAIGGESTARGRAPRHWAAPVPNTGSAFSGGFGAEADLHQRPVHGSVGMSQQRNAGCPFQAGPRQTARSCGLGTSYALIA